MRVGRECVVLFFDKEFGFKVMIDSLFDGCVVFINCVLWVFDVFLRDFCWSYDLLLVFVV